MKEIKAIIQPFVADQVLAALREMAELPGATVSEVKGFGRGRALGVPQLKAILVNLGAVCAPVALFGGMDFAQCPRGLSDFLGVLLHSGVDLEKWGPASARTGSYPWCILAGEWEKRGQRVIRFAGNGETTVP